MKIKLSPVRMDTQLTASVSGEVLTFNSETVDLSDVLEGESSVIDSQWIVGPVLRIDGELHLILVLPHGANAPHETRFPAAYTYPMTVEDGTIPLPPYDGELTKNEDYEYNYMV